MAGMNTWVYMAMSGAPAKMPATRAVTGASRMML